MNCVSRRCDSPRQIPCSVGRGGQAGEPWMGSLLLGAYESVACRTGMQARVSLVPGRSSRCGPRNTVLWPPGRTGHVAGVSTASPAQPPASWGRKTNSPQRNHGDGGSLGTCLPAGRRPALLPKVTGTGQPCWGRGSVRGARAAADRQEGLRAPDRAYQVPWRQASPLWVPCSDPRCCFTSVSEFSGCRVTALRRDRRAPARDAEGCLSSVETSLFLALS